MFLFRLLRNLVSLIFWPLRRLWEVYALPAGSFVTLSIDGQVLDFAAPKKRIFEWLRRRKTTVLSDVFETLELAREDDRVRGVWITLEQPMWGVAQVTSVHDALKRLREAGKQVVVFLPQGADSKAAWVSAAATRVVLGPDATFAPLGFLSKAHYARQALAKAGLEAEVYAKGRYKSAGERLVRDEMSDAEHEQVSRLLDAFYDGLGTALAEGRGKDLAWAKQAIDGAPYHGQKAVDAGLCDAVAYDDELATILGVDVDPRHVIDGLGFMAYARARRFRSLRAPKVVAIIPVHGPIVGPSAGGGTPAGVAGEDAVVGMIRLARQSPQIAGVLLHIDSPGGSALASARMHRELELLAKDKPLVACMGNVAASGGYYVAAPAAHIVAQRTTVTGSIGVVGTRFVVTPLLNKLGVTTDALRRGKHVGLMSGGTALNEDEQAALHAELDSVYTTFVDVVARGRKLSSETVRGIAEGRVWTGADAKERGLVDALGGIETAMTELERRLDAKVIPLVMSAPRHKGVAYARKAAGAPTHAASLSPELPSLNVLPGLLSASPLGQALAQSPLGQVAAMLDQSQWLTLLSGRERVLLLSPVDKT
jgi:protease-4